MISRFLKHPLTAKLDINDPMSTSLRRQIIREKPFLENIYREWYDKILSELGEKPGTVLEIGSGAGFLREYIPELITSEVFPLQDIDLVVDATSMDFADSSLDAIVMTDVLHHIPDSAKFFSEAQRTLKPGGKIIMIEPWNNHWSRFIYQHFHHEPFDTEIVQWDFPADGPLSSANGALPWVIFVRDQDNFHALNPQLRLASIGNFMPFSYLLSGGLSSRLSTPRALYGFARFLERRLCKERGGMFALVVVSKTDSTQ